MLHPFHWLVFVGLLVMLALLVVATRQKTPRAEKDDRSACSICGEKYEAEELVEREMTSGYGHLFCGKCVALMYDDALERGLLRTGVVRSVSEE